MNASKYGPLRGGYVEGNVQWIGGLANRIKTEATPEQVLAVGQFLMDKKRSNGPH